MKDIGSVEPSEAGRDMTEEKQNVYRIYDERRRQQSIAGDVSKTEKAHADGKCTAQERMELLFDNGTYDEILPFRRNRCIDFDLYRKDAGNEGVISGFGRVNGRKICAYANDVYQMGASMGEAQGDKIRKVIDLAAQSGIPLVGMNDASGARIQEGVAALNAYCSAFGKISAVSGWIPQLSVILGNCAGGTAYASALTDFIIMVEGLSKIFITGPAVIKAVTGEDVTFEELGGSAVHGRKTGLAHFVARNEADALFTAKRLLSFLPSNSKEQPPVYACDDPPNRSVPEAEEIIPQDRNKGFDMRRIILSILDNGDLLEVQERFATNMIVGFGRLCGRTVGIVANQPRIMAGCIDIDASWKAARFVRFCDSFNIPLLTFADCPGYLPGVDQEHGGIIRNGAKLLFAYSEATVPKITTVVRKSYGGAYSAMCGKGLGADIVFALPTAELAVMGAEGAVNIIFRKEIAQAAEPEALRARLTEEYDATFLNPYKAAEYGIVDDIIRPAEMRAKLASALDILAGKTVPTFHKKHSNIPL
jgi:acetyl-CoA carboxylase carboxyltransferase component